MNDFVTPPCRVEFRYHGVKETREAFERQSCRRPTALKGLVVGLTNGTVLLEIQHFLEDRYLTGLVSRMENRYALNAILETRRQVAYPLTVTFVDGQQEAYQLILGSQSFLIHAELRGKWREGEQNTSTNM